MIGLIIHLAITIAAIGYFTGPYREDVSALSKGSRKVVPSGILKQRFANGDITGEEYKTAKIILEEEDIKGSQ